MREQSQLLKQIPPPAEIGRELARVLTEAAALRALLRASKRLYPRQENEITKKHETSGNK
jgi:hypothetical protein